MPQAVPFIIAAGKAVAFKIGTYAVTYATLAKVAIVAGSAIYSRNQAKKAARAFASLRDQGTSVTFSDPMAVSAVIYGEIRVGGVVVFAHTTGASNSQLHQVMALCPHSLTEIDDIYFGDEALGMPWNSGSPSNVPDGSSPYSGYVRINRKVLGGAADSELVSESGGAWTTDDKMTDISSLYVKTTWNVDVFPQGLSFNISCDVKGKECYDPRDASTGYTQNPALILRDYLINFCGFSSAEIDDDDVVAAANICDESVTIADTTTQQRYTFNGRILTDTKPADGRQMIARSMAGWCAKVGAKWRMKAGADQSSSLSLTADDFIGPIEFVTQDDISEACNAIRGTYVSAANNWQPAVTPLVRKIVTAPNITAGARCTIVAVGDTDFTAIGAASNTVGLTFTASGAGTGTGTVDPYLGEDNGVEHVREVDLFGVTDEAHALRLLRIQLEEARHGLTFSCEVPHRGLRVQAGDYVDVTLSRYGWTGKMFRVAMHREVHRTNSDGMFIAVQMVLREVSSAIYTRTSADETTADPSPNTDLQDPREVVAPVLGTLESDDDQLTIDSRGAIVSRIKVPWTCADPYVTSGGTFELEYKLSADSDWLPAPISPPKGSDEVAWIGPVVDGEDYDVRIRAVNGIGVHSDWDTETAHTVIGKSEDPGLPTSFTATAIPGGVLLEWVPPTDLDLAGYDIYHAPEGDAIPSDPQFSIAQPATSFAVPDLTPGESTDFWIKSRDTSRNRSAAVGPETAEADPIASPTLWPRGPFSADKFYDDNPEVKSVVTYGGSVYKTSNTAKDGLDTWDTPGTSGDWEAIGVIAEILASGLILSENGYIYDTLWIGDGSSGKGKIMTYGVTGYGTGADGVFLGINGTTGALYAGDPSGEHLSYYNGTAEVIASYIELGSASDPVVIDIDSSFVGPNPPARLTFGSMQATASSGKTTLGFSSGGVAWGSDFSIGKSYVTTHYIDPSTGNAKFNDLTVADDLVVTDELSARSFTAEDGIILFDSGNEYFQASAASGEFRVSGLEFQVRTLAGADVFTVDDATGNTLIGGTLGVTGKATFSANVTAASFTSSAQADIGGTLTVGNGSSAVINFHTDNNLYRVSSGILKIDGTMHAGGGFGAIGGLAAYNGSSADYVFSASALAGSVVVKGVPLFVATSGGTPKFEVAHATGNTTIAGTLGVTGTTTLAAATTTGLTSSGDLLVNSSGDKFRAQASNGAVLIQGNAVLGIRQTGWGAPTGTLSRAAFDPSTVTPTVAYQTLAALITDLRTHGMIGN